MVGLAIALGLSACAPAAPTPTPDARPTATGIPAPSQSPTATPTPSPEPTFDRGARSIDDPASLWVVANKLRPLQPADYAPADLRTADIP